MISSKENKIEPKRNPSHFSQKICWICHQTDRSFQEEVNKNLDIPIPDALFDPFNVSLKKPDNVEFKPCLCKGSLENVHKECLNLWVLRKYQSYIHNFSEKEEEMLFNTGNCRRNEFKIQCPNCKSPLNYTISEKRVLRSSQLFKLDTKEKMTLFLLILLQVLFLFFDLRSLYKEKNNNNSPWSLEESMQHILYLGTVVIILSAGAFNLFDLIGKEIVLEVVNKD